MNALPSNLLVLCLAALLTAPLAAWARSSDRNQPMDLNADKSDCSVNDTGPCVFVGNVKIVQGTLLINAAKADVKRANGDISFVQLTGSQVTLKQQLDDGSPFNGRANRVDYDMPSDIVTLIGDAFVEQPSGNIKSERIVYNMKTGQVQSGGDNGRVNMRLNPKNKAPASAPASTAPTPAPATTTTPAPKTGGG